MDYIKNNIDYRYHHTPTTSDMYVSPADIHKKYGISKSTLRRWRIGGEIEAITTKGNHHRYLESSIRDRPNKPDKRDRIYHCRVSSHKQKDDLERQKEVARKDFPHHRIVQDIGSGLNLRRKGLLRMVDRIIEGAIGEVVVAHRDRLCRFAFDLLEWICKRSNCKLVVQNQVIKSSDQELSEDLMAIVHVFSCRHNGRRRYKSKENPTLTDEPTGEGSEGMDGGLQEDVEHGPEVGEGTEEEDFSRPEKRRCHSENE